MPPPNKKEPFVICAEANKEHSEILKKVSTIFFIKIYLIRIWKQKNKEE